MRISCVSRRCPVGPVGTGFTAVASRARFSVRTRHIARRLTRRKPAKTNAFSTHPGGRPKSQTGVGTASDEAHSTSVGAGEGEPSNTPDRKTYKAVGILSGSQFISNLGFGCVIPVLPLFAVEMNLGPSGVGIILSISAVSRLICNIPFGRLGDSIGRKPLMIVGQLGVAVASFGTAMCTTLPALLGWRLLLGCAGSASATGSNAYMADVTASIPHHRAKLMGFQMTVMNMAYAVGPALGGWLCDMYGARTSFLVVGAAAGASSVTLSLLKETIARHQRMELWPALRLLANLDAEKKTRPASQAQSPSQPGVEPGRQAAIQPGQPVSQGAASQPSSPSPKSMVEVFGSLLKDRDQQGVMSMNFALFSSYSALMAIFPLHAMEVMGDSGTTGQVGLLFATGALTGFIGAPLGGWLADRLGRKNTVIPAAGLIAMGAIACTLPGVDSFYTLLPTTVIWGLGNSMCNPGLSAYAADLAKDGERGQALSLARQAGDFALLLAPVGLGTLAQFTSCSTALWATAGVVTIANASFALRTTERWKR